MIKLVKECAPWLNWRSAGVIALVALGLVLCTGLPSLGVLAGIAPLLLIIACLVPCLAPLVLLRKKNGKGQTLHTIALTAQGTQGCSCGNACRVGGVTTCQSEGTAEAARS